MVLDKPSAEQTARQLNSGAIHLLRGLRQVDREAQLTPARLSALSVLVFGGPCTLGRLATIEGVAGPTMTRIVDGLCELGLAERTTHPDSARFVLIAATPDGESLMQDAAARRVSAIVAGLARLTASELASLRRAAPVLMKLGGELRWQADPTGGTGRWADRR